MKFRRILYLSGILLPLLVVLIIDVIRKNVEIEIGGLSLLRGTFIILAVLLLYAFLESFFRSSRHAPVRNLGLLLVVASVLLFLAIILSMSGDEGFDAKNYALIPLDYGTIFLATLISLLFAAFSVYLVRVLRDLVLFKRKRGTQRNFLLFVGLTAATALSTIFLHPLEDSILTGIFFGVAVAAALLNAFRLSWIVYLTKREKLFGLLYAFLLFVVFTGLNIVLQSSLVSKSLLYYSYPLRQFVLLTTLFGTIYFGMAFVSTLFHLPTAEAFDRKSSEVSSLHNLSKLVTQVFDFHNLVETVTTMTLEVCEARSCWLEIMHAPDEVPAGLRQAGDLIPYNSPMGEYQVHIAGTKNITRHEIDLLHAGATRSLRDLALAEGKPVVFDDVARDERMRNVRHIRNPIGSLAVVPLLSHAGLVGILYVTKENEYGFFKDDVDVISAFADQATIAIENSRLINKSLERERLQRELLVAQEMQKRLLPQTLPRDPHVEIDAVSTPASEVGGDYYDFVELDDRRLGIAVGDVSGKGVSAAFYMSEVKGIFQALSRLYTSPRLFMEKANEALTGSIDKRSFVSLIYAVLDRQTGVLTLSRAGHCPMLLVSQRGVQYIRPSGMGMGMSHGSVFADAIEEKSVTLVPGDVCVFYTDGVTEARRGDDEFGYERLRDTVARSRGKSASAIKEDVLATIHDFTNGQASHDDLTLVILKWRGESPLTHV